MATDGLRILRMWTSRTATTLFVRIPDAFPPPAALSRALPTGPTQIKFSYEKQILITDRCPLFPETEESPNDL